MNFGTQDQKTLSPPIQNVKLTGSSVIPTRTKSLDVNPLKQDTRYRFLSRMGPTHGKKTTTAGVKEKKSKTDLPENIGNEKKV